MATAALSTIDITKQATYPIRLGNSVLKPAESKQLSSVIYNYRPKLRDETQVEVSIKPSKSSGYSTAFLKSAEEEYSYSGRHSGTAYSYVLLLNGSEAVVERVKSSHVFNVQATPTEKDSAKLEEQYPHLELDENGEVVELAGDNDAEEQEADPSNPFDYRHFLKAAERKVHGKSAEQPRSSAATPLVHSRAASSTPLARPTKRAGATSTLRQKRKAPASSQLNTKRIKAGSAQPSPVLNKPAQRKTEAPRIRVDRKASVRRPSYDDSGELILENETPKTEKPGKQPSAMALALSGQLGQGPISLRSAASSPASRVASPLPERPEHVDEGQEFEFGSVSPEASAAPARGVTADDEGYADEEDADGDVEDLELPSPAAVHRPSVIAAIVTGGDDEDDLDKQLELAMAEDEDAAPPVQAAGDDEESEEE